MIINDFAHSTGWKEVVVPKMTKAQIEDKLGYEIEYVDESEEK